MKKQSYRKTHVKNKIHKITPKKSVFTHWWFWVIWLILILFIAFFYFFLFYLGLQVKNVVVSGNEKVSTQDLQKIVFDGANTGLVNFLGIKINTRSIFLVNSGFINGEILGKFPEIENVSLSRNFPQMLVLKITERQPIGVYCQTASSIDNCFLIDKDGIIFAASDANPGNLAVVRSETENQNIYTGENVVGQNVMSLISILEGDLKSNYNIDVTQALVTSPIRLDITTGENWQIYMNMGNSSDVGMEIEKLDVLLKGDLSSDKRKGLRYVDLRPDDRAIICDNATCGNN